MRACDSSTATATGSAVAPPVFTSAVASEGWLIVVGCSAGLMVYISAIELPPDTEDSLPARVKSSPCAPALAMPYMGLMVLDWVSFCDIAGITAPLVPAVVAGVVALERMPRRMAPSACHRSPSALLMNVLDVGTMLPGTPSLPNPAVERKLACPPCTPTSASEPTRFAPPARSKQMNGTPAGLVGTLHCPVPSSAWISGE